MSFDDFLGSPYVTALESPPDEPIGLFDLTAGTRSGRFLASSRLDIAHPGPRTIAARFSAIKVMPRGIRTVFVTFKLAIGHFTMVNVIPGPGYVSAACGLDLLAVARRADGTMLTALTSRLVLAHAWIVLVAPIGGAGNVPEMVMNPSFTAPVPGGQTEEGDVWQFTIRPWAETGGAGFFIPLATAQVSGSVYGFRVTGV